MMIEFGDLNFNDVVDPIKTEETIYNQLKDKKINFDYVGIPIAFRINNFGVGNTQNIINQINDKFPQKKVYVCQHIYINQLNFGDNIVFTPHTIQNDSYYFLPHYNPIFNKPPQIKKNKDRKYMFSFMGDYNTNQIRSKFENLSLDESYIQSTGQWFFSHIDTIKSKLRETYTEVLLESKFPLCPPGTGPSTLRLFESYSVGGIPIIFNNLKLPKELELLTIKLSDNLITKNDLISKIPKDDLDEISKEIYDTYWSNFSNEKLSDFIIKTLDE